VSIHFISGKPGGGKSYYALRLIVDELRHTKRNIVTNLSIIPGNLAEFLHKTYDDTFGMSTRLRILSAEEAGEFWLHPALYSEIPEKQQIRIRDSMVARPDFSKRAETGGTLFVIDEIHLYFNSRNWQSTGEDCLFYLSQHRKLGDDVAAVTQHIGNVDKQFRSVAQDYTYLRNCAKERVGLFRSLPRMVRSTYSQPSTGAPGERAMETALVKLDTHGLASCYDTASGVGIIGRSGADTSERKRGLPFSALILMFVLMGAMIWFVPFAMGKGVKAFFHKDPVAKVGKPLPVVTQRNTNELPPTVQTQEASSSGTQFALSVPILDTNRTITSMMVRGGMYSVWLSDDSKYTQGKDVEFSSLSKRGAIIDGLLVKWATHETPSPAGGGGNFFGRVSQNGTLPIGTPYAGSHVIIGPPKGPVKARLVPTGSEGVK